VRLFLFLVTVSACTAQDSTAAKLIAAGHWKQARLLVEQRLREAPDDPDANFLASQIRNAFGDRSSPPVLAEKAVRLDGGVARYHRQLAEVQGVMAQRAGILQQVVLGHRFRKEIDTALELDPRDVQALRDLLEFYLLAPGLLGGDVKKADAVARQMAALNPAQGFLAQARIAEFRKDWAQTEASLRRAADVTPASYNSQIASARFYLAPEHHDDRAAEVLGRTALALDAGRVEAYCVLAVAYAERPDWNGLESVLSSAAHEVPDDLAPYYRAAERLLEDGRDPFRAEGYLRRYLTQEPEGNQPTTEEAQQKLGFALKATRKGGAN